MHTREIYKLDILEYHVWRYFAGISLFMRVNLEVQPTLSSVNFKIINQKQRKLGYFYTVTSGLKVQGRTLANWIVLHAS